jgi:glycerophosphoryl diester phosphodiesterase
MLAALVAMRRRFPAIAARALPEMGVSSIWVYHPIASRRLAKVAEDAGIELIAWTVDDAARMRALVAAGVDGICSNDPRLFAAIR